MGGGVFLEREAKRKLLFEPPDKRQPKTSAAVAGEILGIRLD
jgi:hypothetical protein